jgi:CcmD family protein
VVLAAAVPAVAADGPPLVSVAAAVASEGPVRVAGTVQHATVREVDVEGLRGISFQLEDPAGDTLTVVHPGKKPFGFDVASVVVVGGTVTDGSLRSTGVLIPGAADWSDPNRGLQAVMGVTMVVWVGLFAYVLRLSRKLRRLEEAEL